MSSVPAHLVTAASLVEEAIGHGDVAMWLDAAGKGQLDGPVSAELRARLKAAGPEVREYLKWNLTDTGKQQRPETQAAWVKSGVELGMWMPQLRDLQVPGDKGVC